ncbi:hypothetical protein HYW21_02175 [Candidatus Woesearchaeota archaeon]|nr:hypothetical protein [Candidatus Woesearchaeota archaeon]
MFVSNASTLILLAKINSLQTFVENAPRIVIPEVVQAEIFAKKTFDTMLIAKEIQNKKISVQKTNPKRWEAVIDQFRLDAGEAATYALFDKRKHGAILTDDGELMKVCKLKQIPFICALAIVVRQYEKKVITKEQALRKLQNLVEIGRYSQRIYDHFKQEVI